MVHPSQRESPRRVSLDATPEEVAARLRHLDGLVFFDSAGNLPQDATDPVSIIAARPIEIITGQREELPALVKIPNDLPQETDLGFPTGGLCGWIDYEGDFTFGVFPEMMIYHHRSGEWHEVGQLSQELRETSMTTDWEVGPWEASVERNGFLRMVERAQEYIRAGDIYQVNLSRRLRARCKVNDDLFSLYQSLRSAAPAPMAAYLHLAEREVLSSSPELFLRISGRTIETRPIKGTRPRFADPEMDLRSAYELQRSEKEAAELVMITDLLRNDLGMLCDFGSVEVSAMLQLEKLQHVHHLVSTVRGQLRPGVSSATALTNCLPGGSITGAPKKRATEIIAELEPVPRDLYTGAIGYIGFNGEAQFNIAIRTLRRENGWLTYNVGAGIVADSQAEAEFEETEHKAAGVRLALANK